MKLAFLRCAEPRIAHVPESVALTLPIEKPEMVEDPATQIAAALHMQASSHELAADMLGRLKDARRALEALESELTTLWDRTRHASMYVEPRILSSSDTSSLGGRNDG